MSESTAASATAHVVESQASGQATRLGATTGATTARRRRAHIALRSLQIVLALFYGVASALPKLIAHPTAVEGFDKIGWGGAGMYTIGVLELLGAIALVVPVLSSVAAVALSGLMVGAFITQLTVFDGQNAATPLILIVPLALIAWARREHTVELLRLLRLRA